MVLIPWSRPVTGSSNFLRIFSRYGNLCPVCGLVLCLSLYSPLCVQVNQVGGVRDRYGYSHFPCFLTVLRQQPPTPPVKFPPASSCDRHDACSSQAARTGKQAARCTFSRLLSWQPPSFSGPARKGNRVMHYTLHSPLSCDFAREKFQQWQLFPALGPGCARRIRTPICVCVRFRVR